MAKPVQYDEDEDSMDVPTSKKKHDSEDDDAQAPKKKAPASHNEDEDATPAPKRKPEAADDDDDDAPRGKKKKKADEDAGGDVEWGDEKLMRPTNQLERLAVKEKNRFVRFSLLPFVNPKRRDIHYVQGKGYAFCNSTEEHQAVCCEKLGDPQPLVAALVVHYTNASTKDGKFDPSKNVEFEIKSVNLSQTAFRTVSLLPEEDQSPFDMDVIMSLRTNGKGYEYRKIKSSATWKKNPALAKAVEAACEKFLDGKLLVRGLGKKLTPAEMRVFVGSAEVEDDDMDGMDDV